MAPLPRSTLQNLATAKVEDARLLFENQRYSNAYYLYGYGVELGLKACVARLIQVETIPDKLILSGFLTHNVGALVNLAGLKQRLEERQQDGEFDTRWAVVSQWSEQSRYEIVEVAVATAMRDAVEHPTHGIMTWLQQHW